MPAARPPRMRTICIYDAASSRRAHRAPPPCTAARRLLASLALLALATPLAQAQGVVNIYSARHYQTDEAFYANFTARDRHQDQPARRPRGRAGRADQERGREQPGRHPDHGRRLAPGDRRQGRPVPAGAVEGARGAHPGASAHAELARVLDPRPGHRLQQGGDQPRLGADLRRPRRSAPEGPDLRALGQPSLQPVARRGADRPRRRGEDRAVGARPGRQLRARAQGRRHRPAEGRRRRRMRRRPGQQLLRRPPDALDRRRTTRRR